MSKLSTMHVVRGAAVSKAALAVPLAVALACLAAGCGSPPPSRARPPGTDAAAVPAAAEDAAAVAPEIQSLEVRESSKQFLEKWRRGFLGADAGSMASFYEDSGAVTSIQSTGVLLRGIAAIQDEYAAAFEEVVFEAVELGEMSIRQGETGAWATARFTADTRHRGDGTRWRIRAHASWILERSQASWKIVLEHFSPLADTPRVERRA